MSTFAGGVAALVVDAHVVGVIVILAGSRRARFSVSRSICQFFCPPLFHSDPFLSWEPFALVLIAARLASRRGHRRNLAPAVMLLDTMFASTHLLRCASQLVAPCVQPSKGSLKRLVEGGQHQQGE
jgi:hypothetical protein